MLNNFPGIFQIVKAREQAPCMRRASPCIAVQTGANGSKREQTGANGSKRELTPSVFREIMLHRGFIPEKKMDKMSKSETLLTQIEVGVTATLRNRNKTWVFS